MSLVLLLDNKETGDLEHELPTELVDQQQAALEKVRQALTGNGWVVKANYIQDFDSLFSLKSKL